MHSNPFKQWLEKHPFDGSTIALKPYHVKKGEIKTYKMIFFVLGAIFLGLTYALYTRMPQDFCHMLFHSCTMLKWIVTSFSALLAAIAFSYGFLLRTEREVMRHLARSAKRKLHRIYVGKKIRFRIGHLLQLHETRAANIKLKHAYHTLLEKLEKDSHYLFLRIDQIRLESFVEREAKEEKFNEAFLAFQQHADAYIHEFETWKLQ